MCMKLSVCATLVLVLSLAVGTQADLVGYWSFDEGAGTIAHDSSGNGLDGTLNGDPQWVAGQLGGALEFDGNDFVEIPHSPLLSITEKITITAWTYMSANASGEMAIVSKGGWAANDLPYELTEEAGTVIYWQFYDDEGRDTCAPTSPPVDEWYHIAGTYDGQIFKCHIDDFETYADAPFLEIWDTWIDGFDDPGNGATVGNGNEPEKSIVFEGGKSMPIHYDNSGAPVSTATRTFDPALDWTIGSPTTLSLHVRGVDQPDNDGQPIYVIITDRSGRSATVSYKERDPTATLNTVFEPWLIPLADLAPVSLGSIESVTVGIGTPGGAPSGARGIVYVDLLRVGTPLP